MRASQATLRHAAPRGTSRHASQRTGTTHAASGRAAGSRSRAGQRGSHVAPQRRSRAGSIGTRAAVGVVAGSIFLWVGPGAGLAQAPRVNRAVSGSMIPVTGQALTNCIGAVSTLLSAQLGDVAAGIPDQNTAIVEKVRSNYLPDPSGWAAVEAVYLQVQATATADFLDTYGRDVNREVAAYQVRIRSACLSS